MKWTIQLALLAMASLAPISAAVAQMTTASIPFDFTVQEKTMPAGRYVIESVSDVVINLRSTDGKYHELSLVNPAPQTGARRNVLVFERYGDQYFLREIRVAPKALNFDLPVTKAEKKAQINESSLRKAATTEIAMK